MEGTPFGRYRLVSLLGEGGMGEVWRAHDTVTDRVVAIKVLSAKLSKDGDFQQRFRREAHAAARLSTPHVVPIHDYGEIEGQLFVSMRLIEGRDLAAVLAEGPLAPERAVRIVGQVAEALHAAHGMGLIHRDIKPSNILLDDRDFAYLIDFGIARAVEDTRMTRTGNTIGTFAYIAPERLSPSGDEDARVDIYSLACVLYEALTGVPPFPGDTLPLLVAAHLNAPPPRPSVGRPEVPAGVDAVIATGMAKDPARRYGTTIELAEAAREALTVPIPRVVPVAPSVSGAQRTVFVPPPRALVGPPPLTRPSGGGRRMAVVLGVAAVVVVAVIVAVVVGIGGDRAPGAAPSSPSSPASPAPAPAKRSYGTQVALPFTGLNDPDGVAVDSSGSVYVVDYRNNRVVKVAAGSSTQQVLPFTGLKDPWGVAVDGGGTVYITDQGNSRVLALAAGSSDPRVLPFTGLGRPKGVAVDRTGSVYVTDTFVNDSSGRVVALAAGSSDQRLLPFNDLLYLAGAAVDGNGTLYVAAKRDVMALAAGSNTAQELLFTGLDYASGVAVDGSGTVYIADRVNNRVVALAPGSSDQQVLPFTGLHYPGGVAVDGGGNLYVTDADNNRVLKLPVQ